jgi:hypothetical protein
MTACLSKTRQRLVKTRKSIGIAPIKSAPGQSRKRQKSLKENYATVSPTSTLPRVALEYGQI